MCYSPMDYAGILILIQKYDFKPINIVLFCFFSGNLSSLNLGVVVTNNSLIEVTVIDHVDTLKDTVSYEVGM